MNTMMGWWSGVPVSLQDLAILVLQILGVAIAVILSVAMMTLAERKVIG